MVISSLLEIISIGAVVPFLGLLSSPETLFKQPTIQYLSFIMGIEKADQLLFPLTCLFIVATLFAASIRLLLLYCSTRISFATGTDLSIDIYKRTLYQDYETHISRNSSEIINSIITKTNIVISKILIPILNFISSLIIGLGIIAMLFYISVSVSIISFIVFGSSYFFIGYKMKHNLLRNSTLIARNSDKMVKSLQEGLGGIRDVLVNGTQPYYCKIYNNADSSFRRASADNVFISGSPRYFMEGVGITFIALMAYYLSHSGGISAAIPVLGAFAVGAQKVLPALQQIYSSYTLIRGANESTMDVLELLDQPMPTNHRTNSDRLHFRRNIVFENVFFKYSEKSNYVLTDINLSFKKGEKIGIVGATGCGKSTLIDLVMGLLKPTHGAIFVDGVKISDSNIRKWHALISHVPQNIFLSDATIKENIAFGCNPDRACDDDVQKAANTAKISDTIDKLSLKYNSLVGERGVQLSGGQRQRIGIARALFRNSEVLVFDEATSALDTETEEKVMEEINSLDDQKTIFIVAHRLSTLKNCEKIYKISKDGKILPIDFVQLTEELNKK